MSEQNADSAATGTELLLPKSLVQLLHEFDAIDQVWCFCKRLRIVPTLTKVGEIFRSTLQRELDLLAVRRLAAVAPAVLSFTWTTEASEKRLTAAAEANGVGVGAAVDESGSAPSFELEILLRGPANGNSAKAVARRHKDVYMSLLRYTARQHAAFVASCRAAAEGEGSGVSCASTCECECEGGGDGSARCRGNTKTKGSKLGPWCASFKLASVAAINPVILPDAPKPGIRSGFGGIRQKLSQAELKLILREVHRADGRIDADAAMRAVRVLVGSSLPTKEGESRGAGATSTSTCTSISASSSSSASSSLSPSVSSAVTPTAAPADDPQDHSGPAVVHVERIDRREARFAAPLLLHAGGGVPQDATSPQPLVSPIMARALHASGIPRLFIHQARAIEAASKGAHVACCTGTASGKSLCYNVPVLEALLAHRRRARDAREAIATHNGDTVSTTAAGMQISDDESGGGSGDDVEYAGDTHGASDVASTGPVALYLFPTKALAQDQLRALNELLQRVQTELEREEVRASPPSNLSWGGLTPITCATLDGDTSHATRADVRSGADIVLTNPDMLHATLLPGHAPGTRNGWWQLLRRVQFVVIDEAHVYRGTFGAHIACVLRRLWRLCAAHRAVGHVATNRPADLLYPQAVCCSATIGNPREHFEKLLPRPVAGMGVDRPLILVGGAVDGCGRGTASSNGHADCPDGTGRGLRLVSLWRPALRRCTGLQLQPAIGPEACARERDEDGTDCALVEKLAAAETGHGAGPWEDTKDVTATDAASEETKSRAPSDHKQMKVAELKAELGKRGLSTKGVKAVLVQRLQEATTADTGVCVSQHPELESAPESMKPIVNLGSRCRSKSRPRSSAHLKSRQPRNKRRRTDSREPPPPSDRCSPIVLTARLLAALMRLEIRTVAFCRTRKLTELVLQYAQSILRDGADSVVVPKSDGRALANRLAAYRSGYTKADRRSLEARIFGGELLGLAATCALELGVDVGSLDATIHLGCPSSVSSFWQQAGRAGRGGRPALTLVVLFDSPLDDAIAQNPERLLRAPVEGVALDPSHAFVLRSQILCAAAEAPLFPCPSEATTDAGTVADHEGGDRALFGEAGFDRAVTALCSAGLLRQRFQVRSTAGFACGVGNCLNPVLDDAAVADLCVQDESRIVPVYVADSEAVHLAGLVHNVDDPDDDETEGDTTDLNAGDTASAPSSSLEALAMRELCAAATRSGRGACRISRAVNLRDINPVTFKVIDESRLPLAQRRHADPAEAESGRVCRSQDEDNFIDPDALASAVIDSVEYSRCFYTLYQGAVYLHQGRTYLVTCLDLGRRCAHVIPATLPYFTAPRDHTDVNCERRQRSSRCGTAHFGTARIVQSVWGYRKMWKHSGKIFEMHEFTLPQLEYVTRALWFDICPTVKAACETDGLDFLAGMHAAAHALCATVPLRVMCDPAEDISTEHPSPYQQRARPLRVVIYERRPGGVGICDAVFAAGVGALLDGALSRVRDCSCTLGCPGCVHDRGCSEHNYVIDKAAALRILEAIRARHRAAEAEAPRAVQAAGTGESGATPADVVHPLQRTQYRVQRSWSRHLPNHSQDCVAASPTKLHK